MWRKTNPGNVRQGTWTALCRGSEPTGWGPKAVRDLTWRRALCSENRRTPAAFSDTGHGNTSVWYRHSSHMKNIKLPSIDSHWAAALPLLRLLFFSPFDETSPLAFIIPLHIHTYTHTHTHVNTQTPNEFTAITKLSPSPKWMSINHWRKRIECCSITYLNRNLSPSSSSCFPSSFWCSLCMLFLPRLVTWVPAIAAPSPTSSRHKRLTNYTQHSSLSRARATLAWNLANPERILQVFLLWTIGILDNFGWIWQSYRSRYKISLIATCHAVSLVMS